MRDGEDEKYIFGEFQTFVCVFTNRKRLLPSPTVTSTATPRRFRQRQSQIVKVAIGHEVHELSNLVRVRKHVDQALQFLTWRGTRARAPLPRSGTNSNLGFVVC